VIGVDKRGRMKMMEIKKFSEVYQENLSDDIFLVCTNCNLICIDDYSGFDILICPICNKFAMYRITELKTAKIMIGIFDDTSTNTP
jgi:rubrerythrin